MSHAAPVDQETRNVMRKEIWTVLAQTGNYPDTASIEKSTLDFEGRIYNTCGASYPAYKKSIEGKLSKIRTAFIPPGFDSRRQRYTEWFNTNRHVIRQLQKRPDWNASISPNISKYLAAPLSAQFINMSQLDELVAVKAEYARLYTAAVQKYKQRKDAALPVAEALQELLAQVLQASRGITAALPASTTSASSSLDLDQPPLCHCLNLRLLQETLSCLSDYLTPFFVLKKKESSSSESSATSPAVCAVCPEAEGGDKRGEGKGARYLNLKVKFAWSSISSSSGADTGRGDEEKVGALFALIFPRLELLVDRYIKAKDGSGFDDGSLSSGCCTTRFFIAQQTVHFSMLAGWLCEIAEILRRTVLPVIVNATEATVTSSTTTAAAMASKNTGGYDTKAKSVSDIESESEVKNAKNFKFNDKRALNLANYSSSNKKRLTDNRDTPLPGGTGVPNDGRDVAGSGGPFLSLSDVFSAVEQRHPSVHWALCAPAPSSSSSATSVSVPPDVQGFQLTVKLHTLLLGSLEQEATSCPSFFEDENTKCVIHIAVDEQLIPLYATISLTANRNNDERSSFEISDQQEIRLPVATAVVVPTPPRFERPDSSYLHAIYRQMNEFLTTERRTYDFSTQSGGGMKEEGGLSIPGQYETIFNILARFTAYFNLSDSRPPATVTSSSSSSALCSQLRICAHTGFVTVESCLAAV